MLNLFDTFLLLVITACSLFSVYVDFVLHKNKFVKRNTCMQKEVDSWPKAVINSAQHLFAKEPDEKA